MTPKAIANKIKSKGLQKLRWYCEMCEKQCRDENGFKCHCMSEGHLRQMKLFADAPGKFLNEFSSQFMSNFLRTLKHRHGTKRVQANSVYQEYISDRNHMHMNATRWSSLSEFVTFLGRQGYCSVEDTEKGWFISYIERDPEVLAKQEALRKREELELDEEQRNQKLINEQIERAKQTEGTSFVPTTATELQKAPDEKIVFKLPSKSSLHPASDSNTLNKSKPNPLKSTFAQRDDEPQSVTSLGPSGAEPKVKRPALEEGTTAGREVEDARLDHWLFEDVVVKVLNKTVGNGKYYKQKGVVVRLVDNYVGEIRMLDSGDILRLDQEHCETVIPNVGGKVLIVNGAYRGQTATLQAVDFDQFTATLCISSAGASHGRVCQLPYEDFSKLYHQ